jgi:ABC-type uncharacterized transport system permease subunit
MELTGFEQGLLYTALGIYAAATFVAGGVVAGRRPGRRLAGMLVAGCCVLTALGAAMWIRQGRPPLLRKEEILIVAGWCIAVATTLLYRRYQHPILLLVGAPTVALLCLFGWLLALRPDVDRPDALHPGVLVHILIAVLGLAAFTFAAGVGAYYLWQIRQLKRHPSGALGRRMPPLELLDRLNFGAAAIGFPLLAMSVVGAWIFSSRAKGQFGLLVKDPTVLVTLGGLVVYLVLFGARGLLGWRGRRIAWLSVVGFVFIVVGLVVAAFCTSPQTFHAS